MSSGKGNTGIHIVYRPGREHKGDPGSVRNLGQIKSLWLLWIRSQFLVYLRWFLSMSPLILPLKKKRKNSHPSSIRTGFFPPIKHLRLPSWNIPPETPTNPIILRGPCVSVVLLDHINITLIGTDRPAESRENQRRAKGFHKVWGHWRTFSPVVDTHKARIQQCWHFYQCSCT